MPSKLTVKGGPDKNPSIILTLSARKKCQLFSSQKKEVVQTIELQKNIIVINRISEGYRGETLKRGEMLQR